MHKLVILALISLPLFADFFPQTVHTSVADISGKNIHLTNAFPINGMSGVVIHNYGNNLEAITNRLIQKDNSHTSLIEDDILHHNKLPSINTSVKSGDKVIGGYLYQNVLLLAPDAQTYTKITSSYHKKWIHPDLFALFLDKEGDSIPTKANLADFAKTHQVGLVFIVSKDTAKLLDPISGKIISQQPLSELPKEGKAPFFMHFDKIQSGIFTFQKDKSYYDIMKGL